LEAFVEREKEFCVQIPLKIFCGTWNVNGGKNLNNVAFKGGNLLNSWIFPENLCKEVFLVYLFFEKFYFYSFFPSLFHLTKSINKVLILGIYNKL